MGRSAACGRAHLTREKESHSGLRRAASDTLLMASAALKASAVLFSVSASQRSTLGCIASTRIERILPEEGKVGTGTSKSVGCGAKKWWRLC